MEKLRNLFFKFAVGRIYVGFILVGLVFSVAGCLFVTSTQGYEKTTATVIGIETYNEVDEDVQYEVEISYTVDGKEYTTIGGFYQTGMEVGDTIEISYSPDDPTSIASGGNVILYVLIVAGIAAVIFGVIKLIKVMKEKDSSPNGQLNRVKMDEVDPSVVAGIQNSTEESKDYYFHFTGKLDQDYVMETPDRVTVYEAKCDKFTLLSAFEYTFTNRCSLKQEQFKVTHTVTTEVGSGNVSMITSSGFKVNGQNCWDHLGAMGYSIEPRLDGLKYTFTVSKYGVPVAFMEQAGRNIVLDADKQNKIGDVLTVPGYYKVNCRQSDLDGVFFACFCLGRIKH